MYIWQKLQGIIRQPTVTSRLRPMGVSVWSSRYRLLQMLNCWKRQDNPFSHRRREWMTAARVAIWSEECEGANELTKRRLRRSRGWKVKYSCEFAQMRAPESLLESNENYHQLTAWYQIWASVRYVLTLTVRFVVPEMIATIPKIDPIEPRVNFQACWTWYENSTPTRILVTLCGPNRFGSWLSVVLGHLSWRPIKLYSHLSL